MYLSLQIHLTSILNFALPSNGIECSFPSYANIVTILLHTVFSMYI